MFRNVSALVLLVSSLCEIVSIIFVEMSVR